MIWHSLRGTASRFDYYNLPFCRRTSESQRICRCALPLRPLSLPSMGANNTCSTSLAKIATTCYTCRSFCYRTKHEPSLVTENTCCLDVGLSVPADDVPAAAATAALTTRQVIEAEMAQVNRTDSSYDNDNPRWSQGENVAGETWAASQVVADTTV